MRSFITSAVLATALAGQVMGARSHRHGHLHAKKGQDAERRAVGDIVTAIIDGKAVTWANEYSGGAATSAASSVAAASTAASSAAKATSAASSAKASSAAASSSAKASSSAAASSSSSSSSGTLSSADASKLASMSIDCAPNPAYSSSSAYGIGSGGPFELEFTNNAAEDIILVVWSGYNFATTVVAMGVCETTPNVTVSLEQGSSTTISFNPDNHADSQISGAFAAIYNSTVINYAGQVGNTWGEFTFSTENAFSTLDVSRLIERNGDNMSIQNYKKKGGDKTCLSDMDTCVFVCTDSATSCAYTLANCPVGAAGNTADASGQNGGCAYEGNSGYSTVIFS